MVASCADYCTGEFSTSWSPHTDALWKQIPEPRVFWEPSVGDFGYYIGLNNCIYASRELTQNLFGQLFETHKLAEQARDVLSAEHSLQKACFELGGTGFAMDGDNYCVVVEGSDLSMDMWHSHKSFPSWYYLPSAEACEKLIETHETELLLWLNR